MTIQHSPQSGFSRIGCFFIVLIGFLFWAGGQSLYTAMTNRKPMVVSYQDYVKTKPKASWLMLTNCVLSVAKASYMTTMGSTDAVPAEIFIPVRADIRDHSPVTVLLASSNPEFLATYAEMQKLRSDDEATTWAIRSYARVFVKRDVTGLVRFGVNLDDKDRSKLAKFYQNGGDDFIIIDENKQPSLIKSFSLLGAGTALVLVGVVMRRRNERPVIAKT